MKKNPKDVSREIVVACPELISFIQMRIDNHVLGPEYEGEMEKAKTSIEDIMIKAGLSPGDFTISGEVCFVLRLSPTTKAPVGAKVVEIPLVRTEV